MTNKKWLFPCISAEQVVYLHPNLKKATWK